MTRLLICLLLCAGAVDLRSQDLSSYILATNRTDTAEILNGATLETVARIHFDFKVERMSGAGPLQLNIAGLSNGGCCKEYLLDLATLKLSAKPPSNDRSNFGPVLASPDGQWGARLKNFRSPVLKMTGLQTGAGHDLIPAGLSLPDDVCGGNWAGQGAWSGGRFYYYVACPDHPGFLWSVSPGDTELGTEVQLDPFNQMPGCRNPLPVGKFLVAAGSTLFIYEAAGNKVSRSCPSDPPGGAWRIDPATGRLHDPIATNLHFGELRANDSGSILYGVVHPNQHSMSALQLVALDTRDGTILKSRNLAGGFFHIDVATLGSVGGGDLNAARWPN